MRDELEPELETLESAEVRSPATYSCRASNDVLSYDRKTRTYCESGFVQGVVAYVVLVLVAYLSLIMRSRAPPCASSIGVHPIYINLTLVQEPVPYSRRYLYRNNSLQINLTPLCCFTCTSCLLPASLLFPVGNRLKP